ncbi:hypothetical protein [Sorangium sp. So ce1182]|uniref:hypothetical protein n=1 Tax=Sorangium sp. So ce1182 TaxID=3133334 RepID=UPI003F6059DA
MSLRVLGSKQLEPVEDRVRAKFAMAVPVLEATLFSLKRARIGRLGGIDKVTLADLAREYRAGAGDAGICFEYSVHDALARESPLIHPLASEVLEQFCGISDGAQSILFGPEKDGVIPILESVQTALTDESRIYVGNRGQPPKLKRYIPQIIRAFHRNNEQALLPRSIMGLWKADLFIGNKKPDAWVGTTVKINASHLQSAQGLRIGIYPKTSARDVPRKDNALNLIRLPLPYDNEFMELYYKAFHLVRAFLRADAYVPPPGADLPDSEDRYVAQELEARRDYAVLEVAGVLRSMGQPGLVATPTSPTDIVAQASLSEMSGLAQGPVNNDPDALVSLTPQPIEK